jgi:hypothetical protein
VSHARTENVYIDKFIFARRPHSGAVDYVGRARSRPISVDFFTTFRHPLVYVLTGPKKEVAHVMSCSLLQFLCTACVLRDALVARRKHVLAVVKRGGVVSRELRQTHAVYNKGV